MSESTYNMRDYIHMVETYAETEIGVPADAPVSDVKDDFLADLEALVFKLRAYTENDDGDRALGMEQGMQRAAEMLENLLRRHRVA